MVNNCRVCNATLSKPRPSYELRKLPELRFKHFQAQARMWAQNAFRDTFSNILQAQARMWVQKACRGTSAGISSRRPGCEPRRPPETHFQAVPGACQTVSSESFQMCISKHFQAQARMFAKNASRDTISSISRRRPECRARMLPQTHF